MSKIFIVAFLSGIMGGSLYSLVQNYRVVPLIAQAELFEGGDIVSYDDPDTVEGHVAHQHLLNPDGVEEGANHHDPSEWKPSQGAQRLFFTWVSNVVLATAWSFLLCGIFLFIPKLSMRVGMLWGLLGYLAFFVAPAIGLPPELPGMLAADLEDRQLWWLLTAASSFSGMICLYFGKHWTIRFSMVGFLILPHVFGAPHPRVQGGTAPETLWKNYVAATYGANLILWLSLGLIVAFLFRKVASEGVWSYARD
ncbi:CbtA family protein [Pseudobacteriovorax antillogorgiicola]|uniref:Cobalt transporter subunit CbtA n=1 Tax=Pseudobacteriovorax antillogorgiicola TaxID=1513793 RepID=A0A1Y6CKN1_9BACT|nr:CbtA family protein [Pseudobacteriovorax antillogorgiicola]TCS45696.1 cobalt transporter subunit CbtA [Pseudobacteriovorax antillogorgiicola]SMF73349.1 cobalt transporter subunit CbtA [Pseudobacteriovorax antillogorgiicola]